MPVCKTTWGECVLEARAFILGLRLQSEDGACLNYKSEAVQMESFKTWFSDCNGQVEDTSLKTGCRPDTVLPWDKYVKESRKKLGREGKRDTSEATSDESTKEWKVNGKGKDTHVHAFKAYHGVQIYLRSFLTSAWDEAEMSALRLGGFILVERLFY
jgi:hypothetical protein